MKIEAHTFFVLTKLTFQWEEQKINTNTNSIIFRNQSHTELKQSDLIESKERNLKSFHSGAELIPNDEKK